MTSDSPERKREDDFFAPDQIATFWELALERLKIRAETATLGSSIKVAMAPIRIVFGSTEEEDH